MSAVLRWRSGGWLMLALLATGCVSTGIRPDAGRLAVQAEREAALSQNRDWALTARLGVSDGRDSGSGTLNWTQQGSQYRFQVHAPVTGKTWELRGDDGYAELSGLRAEVLRGDGAEALLREALGWRVPVAQLVDWVRALRAGPAAQISFRDDGLPQEIREAGWTVRYLDYDQADPPMPRKLFAEQGDYRVRLAIQRWQRP
ncbi:MAG: outer membrane lipoprotein LolB [Rhodanobacter denitrificans]|uniref:Outer-membrane lipoprotein LolB n=1 Tax=Rhodanobacter denitrificans TaxID=666685 RepID=A0A2W5MX01_9GAMM|nr:MAG: outer membrane lipoprotein LolB [Rhodanobacter denitrificans]